VVDALNTELYRRTVIRSVEGEETYNIDTMRIF